MSHVLKIVSKQLQRFPEQDVDDRLQYNDKGELLIRCNVAGFESEDLKVEVCGDQLIIKGKHDESREGDNIERCFTRTIQLSKEMDQNKIKCELDDKGNLTIEVPRLKVPSPEQKNQNPNLIRTREEFNEFVQQTNQVNIVHQNLAETPEEENEFLRIRLREEALLRSELQKRADGLCENDMRMETENPEPSNETPRNTEPQIQIPNNDVPTSSRGYSSEYSNSSSPPKDQTETKYRERISDSIVKEAASYIVVNRQNREEALEKYNREKSPKHKEELFKTVVRWGQTAFLLPFERWKCLKNQHFKEGDHAMLLVETFTDDNLVLFSNREKESIVSEYLIEAHKHRFTPIETAKAGRGVDCLDKECETYAKDKKLRRDMYKKLLNVLMNGEYVPDHGKEYAAKSTLVDHITQKHRDENAPPIEWKCSKCKQKFGTQNKRIEHYDTVHIHDVRPPCPVGCGKSFANRRNLKCHLMKMHSYGEEAAHLASGMKSKKSYKS